MVQQFSRNSVLKFRVTSGGTLFFPFGTVSQKIMYHLTISLGSSLITTINEEKMRKRNCKWQATSLSAVAVGMQISQKLLPLFSGQPDCFFFSSNGKHPVDVSYSQRTSHDLK